MQVNSSYCVGKSNTSSDLLVYISKENHPEGKSAWTGPILTVTKIQSNNICFINTHQVKGIELYSLI